MPTPAIAPAMPNCVTRSERAPEVAPELLDGDGAPEELLEEPDEEEPEEPVVDDGLLPLVGEAPEPDEATVGAPEEVGPLLTDTLWFKQVVCPD